MIFDAHGDIFTDMYLQHKENGRYDAFRLRHYDKYRKGDVTASIFVNYTSPFDDDKTVFDETFDVAFKELSLNQDIMKICLNTNDILEADAKGKIGVIIGVEGLKFLDGIEELQQLYDKGLRHAIITWNEENQYGGGAKSDSVGLTEKGIELVKEMERLGIIIDLSHANEQTYYDILKHTTKPVIVSHGNCRALCDHPRNYSDDQLLALKARGGVLGITVAPSFISENPDERNVENLAKHLDYAVKLMGIDHVGLGLDICHYLNGEFTNAIVDGLEDIDRVDNLIQCMKRMGYADKDLEKIKHMNFLRIIKEILN